jgi:MFS family permease
MTAYQTLGFRPMMLSEQHPLTKWIVCFSAACFFFYEFIQMNMFNAISTDLMQSFHITGENLSQLSSTYFYADVIFLFPAGILLDRFSTRKLILIGLGICVISTFLFSQAQTFWLASLFHFASGIGNAFCFLSCMMLASRWFPPKQLALAIGLIVTFAMIGGAVAQTPFEILTAYTGWRMAVFLNGLLGILIFLIIFLFVSDKPSTPELDYGRELVLTEKLAFWPSIWLAISNPQNWYCGLYTSFLNLPLMVLGGLWGGVFLEQVHHFSATQATTISSMLFIGTIVGSPAFGALSDRMGKRRLPVFMGAIASLITVLILTFAHTLHFTAALLLFYLIGFFTSAQVISYPIISESNRKSITGASLGLASVLIMAGAGVFQQLFGILIDLHWNHLMHGGIPIYSSKDFLLALSMFPLTLLIGIGLSLLIKETNCTQQK